MRWWEKLDAPLLGRYRVERLLGVGGMAEVLLAHDERFAGKRVAIKAPNLDNFAPNQLEELLLRFQREVHRQGSEPIVGVVAMLDAGEVVDSNGANHPFLVMDYLSGGSLGDALGGSSGQRANRQTLSEVLAWLRPIATTLDRLHSRKYLHRDVKPDNILFNADGDPFLADFGIATTLEDLGPGTLMSVIGSAGPGSPGYQSPESLRGDKFAASDQFSLAATVYEALAGRLPVAATTRDGWIGALANWKPTPLSDLLPDLPAAATATIMRALSGEVRERFASCSEFAQVLERASHSQTEARTAAPTAWPEAPPAAAPVAASSARVSGAGRRPGTPGATPLVTPRRARWPLAAGVIALLLVVAFFLAPRFLGGGDSSSPEALAQGEPSSGTQDSSQAGESPGDESAGSSVASSSTLGSASSLPADGGTQTTVESQAAADLAAANVKRADGLKAIADKAIADKAIADKAIADKAKADKIIADKLIADQANADALAAAEAQAKRDAARRAMEGRWGGSYSYGGSDTRPPVRFSVDMSGGADTFRGRMTEPNTFAESSTPNLFANLTGTVNGAVVRIRKTYDGTGGQSHSVDYEGVIDRSTMTIRGSWSLGDISGTFQMRKGS